MVQHRVWQQRILQWQEPEELMTPSDEAFGLLVLENYEDAYPKLYETLKHVAIQPGSFMVSCIEANFMCT